MKVFSAVPECRGQLKKKKIRKMLNAQPQGTIKKTYGTTLAL